jgi:hypothetical protein
MLVALLDTSDLADMLRPSVSGWFLTLRHRKATARASFELL